MADTAPAPQNGAAKPGAPVTPAAPAKTNGAAPAKPPENGAAAPKPEDWDFTLPVKVKGREERLDLKNPEHRERVQRLMQKELAGDQALREANKLRTEAQEFFEAFKADPYGVMEKLGLNPDDLAEQRLIKKIEREKMTPEAREAAELKAKLAKYEADQKKTEAERQAETHQREVEGHAQRLNTKILAALDSGGLPKTPEAVAMMAVKMAAYFEETGEHAEPEDVLPEVVETLQRQQASLLMKFDPEQIMKVLGKDGEEFLAKLRAWDLARVAPPREPKRDRPASTPRPVKAKDLDAGFAEIMNRLK